MKIPKKVLLEELGFKEWDGYYEHPDDTLLEDVNDDGSVELVNLIYSIKSMAELDGKIKLKERLVNVLDEMV